MRRTANGGLVAEADPLDSEAQHQRALQVAILHSANFSSIATDDRGVIQIFNVGAQRMLGCAAAEVVNHVTPADLSDPQELVARAQALSLELGTTIAPGFEALVFKARRGIEDAYELTYIRKDGSRLPAVVSVTALENADGTIIGYLLIGTDNTARRQVEAERRRLDAVLHDSVLQLQAAKVVADEANQAKSDFLSAMSHELRSPLNAILGFAQLLDSGQPPPTAEQKDSVDQIMKAGWYLLELINEILDLALIESGRLSLSTEPVALGELLADCQAMIEPQARQVGIGVHFPALDDSWQALADHTRVKQVVVNLLSNAIKYNRVGGRVDVHCTHALGMLARDEATARIPVIALSANAMPRDIDKGLHAGFFHYLTKPINVSEFMTTLDRALDHATAAGALHDIA